MTAQLGLGTAALGRPGYVTLHHATDLGGDYDPSAMESHAHEVLDAAFAAGVRYFDMKRPLIISMPFCALITIAAVSTAANAGSAWPRKSG